MNCIDCHHVIDGRPGPNCEMWAAMGKPMIFKATGCDIVSVKKNAKDAEAKRVEALPDVQSWPKGIMKAEKELQWACESLLRQWGYRASTAPEIVASLKPDATPVKGWYIHLWNARENPMMPDLLIMDANMMRCLAIELKVVSKYQPGQLEFIKSRRWIECREVANFVEVVKGWEKQL